MPVLACYDSTKIHELDALLPMDEVTHRINGIVDPIRYRELFPHALKRSRIGCVCSDQIQKREQENPDQVDDVPVQPAQIHGGEVFRAEVSTHATQEEPCNHDHANDDVGPVQAGHGVVDAKIEVGVGGTLGIHARIWMVGVVIMPPMISMRMASRIVMVIAVIMVMIVIIFGLLGIKQRQTAGRQAARACWGFGNRRDFR